MSREYGRAHSSERVVDHAPKAKKERSSLIAAVTVKGLAPEHCLMHPESVNKAAFMTYLSKVLLPNLEPGSVLVLDNWTVHHGTEITQLVEAHGSKLFYLPTYSPDFNPIEYLFAKIKAFVKKLRPTTTPDLLQAFGEAVLSVTAKDAAETFRHCGYV